MAIEFQFQDPGEGIHEAEVLEVLVSQGDQVEEGQNVLVVETDKASFEVSSPHSGEVQEVLVEQGDRIEVGDTLMRFADGDATTQGEKTKSDESAGESHAEQSRDSAERRGEPDQRKATRGEDKSSDGGATAKRRREDEPDGEPKGQPRARDRASGQGDGAAGNGAAAGPKGRGGPVPATPATRRIARELGVDLHEVEPSDDKGRVRPEDVQRHAEESGRSPEGRRRTEPREGRRREPREEETKPSSLPDFSRWGPTEAEPLRSVRRRTAQRMAQAWREIPHVTHHDLADISELERLRQRLQPQIERQGAKLTITVLVLKALAAALREFPRFNASLDAQREELIYKRYCNIGVATDTERGLLVPVMKDVWGKSLASLASELGELTERARRGELGRDDMAGGTCTITNVGAIGGTAFTPLINYPEVAILGLGRAELRHKFEGTLESPQSRVALMLPLSLAFDHRVIDGAQAARFVGRIVELLSDSDRFVTHL